MLAAALTKLTAALTENALAPELALVLLANATAVEKLDNVKPLSLSKLIVRTCSFQ